MQTRRERSRLGRPLSACSGTGVFVGYASLFGVRDQLGDVVAKGAFDLCLRRKGPQAIRMLFQHDPAEPVGAWLEMRETEKGLHVTGRLDCNVQRGRELLSLLESGGLDGLSIGFRTVTALRDKELKARRLIEIDLWEVSLVTFPMLQGARVLELRSPAWNAAERLFGLSAPAHIPPKCDALRRKGYAQESNPERFLIGEAIPLRRETLQPRREEQAPASLASLFRGGARMISGRSDPHP